MSSRDHRATGPGSRPGLFIGPRSEEGLFTVVQVVVLMFYAVMFLFAFQAIAIVHGKVSWQNAADASARAAATYLARGMNALCATNHLIGEATAMLVVHEAVAGDELETPARQVLALRTHLRDLRAAAHELCKAIAVAPSVLSVEEQAAWLKAAQQAAPFADPRVARPVKAGGMVFYAKGRLIAALREVYGQKLAAVEASDWSALSPLNQQEKLILREYQIVDRVETRSRHPSVVAGRAQLRDEVLPNLFRYAEGLVENTPQIAASAAMALGRENGVRIVVELPSRTLPVWIDPLARLDEIPADSPKRGSPNRSGIDPQFYGPNLPKRYFPKPADLQAKVTSTRDQIVKVSQLARAAFPWVIYHRQPMADYLESKNLLISDAREEYLKQTEGAAKRLFDRMQSKEGMGLYVLRRATLPDKGYENWSDDPADLASLFTVVCRVDGSEAARDSGDNADKTLLSSELASLLKPVMPKNPTATALAMVYNAAEHRPHRARIDLDHKRIYPIHQPKTGWDTLQWKARHEGVIRSGGGPDNGMPYELIGKRSLITPYLPQVQLAWQARLAPFEPGGDRLPPKSLVKYQPRAFSAPTASTGAGEIAEFLEEFSDIAFH